MEYSAHFLAHLGLSVHFLTLLGLSDHAYCTVGTATVLPSPPHLFASLTTSSYFPRAPRAQGKTLLGLEGRGGKGA